MEQTGVIGEHEDMQDYVPVALQLLSHSLVLPQNTRSPDDINSLPTPTILNFLSPSRS